MGWAGSILLIAMLAAFNLYCMDVLMRMRADILVIRKAVAPGKEPFADGDGDGGDGEGEEGGEGFREEKKNKESPAERKSTEWRRRRKGDSAVAAFFKSVGLV